MNVTFQKKILKNDGRLVCLKYNVFEIKLNLIVNYMKAICIFLGSSYGNHSAYRDAATAMGRELAARGITCVYGGSCTGLMNQLADSALRAGGKVVGVTVQANPQTTMHVAHEDGMPIETVMSLNFREVNIITRKDHRNVQGQGY